MENSELLPCPFCGSVATITPYHEITCIKDGWVNDGIACPISRITFRTAKAWNTRIPPRVTEEKVVDIVIECLNRKTVEGSMQRHIARALKAAHPHLFKE